MLDPANSEKKSDDVINEKSDSQLDLPETDLDNGNSGKVISDDFQNAQESKKSLKQKVEDNLTLWMLGTLLAGFLAGLGTYEGVLKMAQLKVVPIADYPDSSTKKEKPDKDNSHLRSALSYIKGGPSFASGPDGLHTTNRSELIAKYSALNRIDLGVLNQQITKLLSLIGEAPAPTNGNKYYTMKVTPEIREMMSEIDRVIKARAASAGVESKNIP